MGEAMKTMAGKNRWVPPALFLVVFLGSMLALSASIGAPLQPAVEPPTQNVPLVSVHAASAGLTIDIDAPHSAQPTAAVTLTIAVDRPDALSVAVDAVASGSVTIIAGTNASYDVVDGFMTVTHATDYSVDENATGRIDFTVTVVGAHGEPIGGQSSTVMVERRGSNVFASAAGQAALALEIFDTIIAPALSPEEAAIQRQAVGAALSVAPPPESGPAPRQADNEVAQQPGEVVLTGDVGWFDSDRPGIGKRQPFVGGTVRAVGPNGQLLDSATTDQSGSYTLSIPPTNRVRIETQTTGTGQAVLVPNGVTDLPHRLTSNQFDVRAGDGDIEVSLTPASMSEMNRAMAVYQALALVRPLADSPTDLGLGQVRALYPVPGKSNYVHDTEEIRISDHDAFDWDVILHEFGHQVARTVGIDDSPGGPHTIGQNLAVDGGLGKELGMKLAWSEGFATFFGTAVQAELRLRELGIAHVGDTLYTDIEPTEAATIEFGVESGRYGDQGAADEVGIARALWDLYDDFEDQGDTVDLGFEVFSRLIVSTATNIFDAWFAITSSMGLYELGEVGCIVSAAGVAPGPSGPGLTDDQPPRFHWRPGGLGTEMPSTQFVFQIFSDDFSEVLLDVNVGAALSYRLPESLWDDMATGGPIRWMVTGQHKTPGPASRPITGCALRFAPPKPPDAAAITAQVTDTCLHGRGRIDVDLTNSGSVPATVAVSLTGLSTRVRSIGPNESTKVPFTGRGRR